MDRISKILFEDQDRIDQTIQGISAIAVELVKMYGFKDVHSGTDEANHYTDEDNPYMTHIFGNIYDDERDNYYLVTLSGQMPHTNGVPNLKEAQFAFELYFNPDATIVHMQYCDFVHKIDVMPNGEEDYSCPVADFAPVFKQFVKQCIKKTKMRIMRHFGAIR